MKHVSHKLQREKCTIILSLLATQEIQIRANLENALGAHNAQLARGQSSVSWAFHKLRKYFMNFNDFSYENWMSCHSNVIYHSSSCHILLLHAYFSFDYFLKCFWVFISKWVDYQSLYPKYSGNLLCPLVVYMLLGVNGDI